MDPSIDYAIQLNNEGVTLLSAGEDQKAVLNFIRSLAMVRKEIFNETPSDESSTSPFKSLRSAMPSQAPLSNLKDSSYFIYNRTMTITPGYPKTPAAIPIYSACIILNLALAYHCLGKQGYRGCIQKAEIMYEMVTKMLAGPPRDNETSVSIRMVAINNLCQIHQEQNRYSETTEEIESLSVLINQAVSSRGFFNDSDLHLLILNVMLWSPPELAPAA
jgi:hypothetical protein